MKTSIVGTITLIVAIFSLQLLSSKANAQVVEPERLNQTASFYNTGDVPPALPYMSITFSGIPKKEIKKVDVWQKEINEKIQKLGGIFEDKDYKKITQVLPDYVAKFIETGSVSITIEFPRVKKGMILYKENKSPPNVANQ